MLLRALAYRNYRLFFGGQAISLIGTWISRIAMSWLVYRMTNSALALGIVGFANQIPTFFLVPFTGVLADRWNRHKMLVATHSLLMIHAFILAILALTHSIQVWHIIVLSVFQGIIQSFEIPARQSFMSEMVEKREHWGNAIALNSSLFNASRLIGPALAGILIAALGEGMCFLLDGLTYIAVIVSLLSMNLKSHLVKQKTTHVLKQLQEGLNYALGFDPIRSILALVALVSLMGISYTVLLPVLAKDVLHGNAHVLGFLTSASGLGALLGALYLASRKTIRGLSNHITISCAVAGLGLMLLGLSHTLWFSLFMLAVIGFGMMVQMASSNTVLQSLVDDDKRGRVLSLYILALMGVAPFGSLLAGGLAHRFGTSVTLFLGGLSCILGSIFFALRLPEIKAMIRPIYIQKGIIPEIESAIQEVEQTQELIQD